MLFQNKAAATTTRYIFNLFNVFFVTLGDETSHIPEEIPVEKLHGYQFLLLLEYREDDIRKAYEANESK